MIDLFRDRLVLPIHGPDGDIHGFIGRRNPTHDTHTDAAVAAAKAGPKYLNTPRTDLYDKSSVLFGLWEARDALAAGATPVLVEGPVDALAVTLATGGSFVGVAALGTALTDQHADQLTPSLTDDSPGVVVATDADDAGWKAAQRAYWHLTARRGYPTHAQLPEGADPADVLHHNGPDALQQLLAAARPLATPWSTTSPPPPQSAASPRTARPRAATR